MSVTKNIGLSLSFALTVLASFSCYATLPSGQQTLDKQESLYLLQADHQELEDPACIRNSILNNSNNRSRLAIGEANQSISTSYDYWNGRNMFRASPSFSSGKTGGTLAGSSNGAVCKMK